MTDAVKSAVARSAYNSITRKNQYPWEEYVAQRETGGRARGSRNTQVKSPAKKFNSTRTSPNKTYSDAASTPNKRKGRPDPALDGNIDQEALLKQQQMLTRAASAAIST